LLLFPFCIMEELPTTHSPVTETPENQDDIPAHILDSIDSFRGQYIFSVLLPQGNSRDQISKMIKASRAARAILYIHCSPPAPTFSLTFQTWRDERAIVDAHITEAREALKALGHRIEWECELSLLPHQRDVYSALPVAEKED